MELSILGTNATEVFRMTAEGPELADAPELADGKLTRNTE